jgi:catechol 2,3-dioxygenase-like lactoylglutathione lyase family enzyme
MPMAKNLRKFVNPKFITVDPRLLARLLERHQNVMVGFDFAALHGDPDVARAKLHDYFMRAEEHHAHGLVADLHRIAELADADGLRLILDQAARLGVEIKPERDLDDGERKQDPKHVALRVYLDHPRVFDAASDMLVMSIASAE